VLPPCYHGIDTANFHVFTTTIITKCACLHVASAGVSLLVFNAAGRLAGLRCLLEMQAAHDLLEFYFIASSNG